MTKRIIHPYIPNSVPEIKGKMLKEIGIRDVEEIYSEIPEHLRFKGRLNLPEPLLSEYSMRRHVEEMLGKNKDCKEYLNFLGAGTWQHYVPEVCNTINSRDEFLTAYAMDFYADHGKGQAFFQSSSMIGDLVEMDVVSTPTYDFGMAVASSIRMAARLTGKNHVLVPKTMRPEHFVLVRNYCKPNINLESVDHDPESGLMDVKDLQEKISDKTAALYIENPSYLGFIETQIEELFKISNDMGAVCIAGVDPISLGVLEAPGRYGADIVCGELQPLGINMHCGGGLAGFIATRDEADYVAEFPTQLIGITTTVTEGEYGYGYVLFERTSYASREEGKEFVGTQAALWGITAGVYLALMGPKGMEEIGEGIMQRAHYAVNMLSEIADVRVPVLSAPFFKEFVVNFSDTGKTVEEINQRLLEKKIFGGKDLSVEFPELGKSALFCVTEVHTKNDIDRLTSALKDIIRP